MKLHLPVRLFKSVLACLAAMASFTVGSGVAWADAQDLTFSGATLTWNTAEDNKAFVDAEDAAASFAEGDNVSFTATSEVSLGEDITAGVVAIESGADVTIDLGAYTLEAEKMVLSGTLDMGGSFTVGSGDTLEIAAAGAVLDSALVMQEKGWLHLDAAVNLNTNDLTLSGKSGLILTATGDGRVYDLVTGISALKDAAGNAINLDSSNNAIANYFDTTLPGSGFWADGILQLTPDGTLQLVRYTDITLPTGYGTTVTVDDVSDISTYSTSATDVIFCVDSSNLTNHCLTIDGRSSALMTESADSWYFTSADVNSLSSLTFSNATTRLFYVATGEKLDFAYLKSVTFSGNTASFGAAIYANRGTVTLSGNGAVTFSGNTASGFSADGGAIYAEYGTVTLSDNGAVTFSGNRASGSYDVCGGAINADDVTLSGNEAVTFSGNSADGYGGAIYAYQGTATLSGNGEVTFSGNTADGYGGGYGGAIYAYWGTVTLSGNGAVTFSGNSASDRGGAISASGGTVTLSGNGAVTFSGNSVSYFGGAINANSGTVTLSGNGEVTFSENTVSGGSFAYGGAIRASSCTVELCGNEVVTFSGNTASGGSSAYGGAIYADEGTVTLSGNGDVLFEKNAEKSGNLYRLRSIYTKNLNLSASAGKKIEFRDSIYASDTVKLNEGGTGDIIFTGATTETDLLAVKGSAGTESEIINSRTSIVGQTNLYRGRLRIEDGAVYQGAGLTVHENSAATVLLKDATMMHTGKAVSFASGTTLAAAGKSALTVGSLTMADGAAWSFEVSAANADKAVLTYSGSLMLSGELSVNLTINGALINGASYQLLTGAAKPTNWTEDNITVTTATPAWSVGFADLTWVDNTLWLYYDTRPDLTIATWTNESNDGLWNTSSVNWEQDEYDYAYQNGVQVVFGDKGADTVTLVGDLAPESVLVNSTQNYSFEGAGKLTGSMNLTKQGTGTLSINTENDYSGGTTIQGGTVVAGTDTALGIGTVSLTDASLKIAAEGVENALTTAGTSSILVQDEGSLALQSAISNSGNLILAGSIDATNLSKASTWDSYVDVNHNVTPDGSGFVREDDFSVTVVNGGTVDSTGATVSYDEQTLVMDGGTGKGVGAMKYDVYRILAGHTASSSLIHQYHADSSAATVTLVTGGTLNADDAATETKVSATGGSINLSAGTLSGTVGGSTIVTVSGTATMSGDNSYTGGTTLNGAALTVTHANALGTGVINTTGESSLTVKDAELILHSVISNSGEKLTLVGNFDASKLDKSESADVYVDVLGNETASGSGFTRSGDFTVSIANGTVDSTGASVSYKGTTLEMTGGVGLSKGGMLWGEYRILSGHEVELSAIVNKAADNLVSTTDIQLNGGKLTADRALTGTLSISGTSTLHGVDFNLGNAPLQNSGDLTLTGSFDASGLSKSKIWNSYVTTSNEVSTAGSGFLREGDFEVTVVTGTGTVDSSGVTAMKYGSQNLTMVGAIGTGVGEMQYDTYRILSGHTASSSAIHGYDDGKGMNALISLADEGTLNADDATTETKVSAMGGSINLSAGTLSGTVGGSTIVTVSGTATMSGENSYTGGTTLNGATLTITHANALGTGGIETRGNSSLEVNGVTLVLGSTINHSATGTLSLSGNIDASALEKSDSDDVFVDVYGAETKNGSGFVRSGDFTVTVVDEGTVDSSAATITWNGTSLTMNNGVGSAKGGMLYGTYRILTGHTASSTAIHGYDNGAGANAVVTLVAGGTLNADDANGVNVTATGGTINLSAGALSGTWANVSVTATGGSLAGSFDGISTLAGTGFVLGNTAVQNNGTLTLRGSFDASGLVSTATGKDMFVDTSNNVTENGSGFRRTEDFTVLVATGTVDSSNAVVTYGGQTLTMTDGTGFGVGSIQYDTYLLKGNDTATVSTIATKAGAALQKIDMQGGTLNVNASTDKLVATGGSIVLSAGTLGGSIGGTAAVTVSGTASISGNNSYSGGTEIDNSRLTITHANALGTGGIVTKGNSSLVVSGVTLVLGDSIANTGKLTLSGSFDASALDYETKGSDERYALDGSVVGADKSGFAVGVTYQVKVVDGGTSINDIATILHDSHAGSNALVLEFDGYARANGDGSYSVFYLEGTDSLAVSTIAGVSSQHQEVLSKVIMDSGTLGVDQSITVDADGGSIIISKESELSGTIADTAVSTGAGNYTGTISAVLGGRSSLAVGGGNIIVSGANSYTGGTSLNNGNLTITHANALGTGSISAEGISSLSVGNGVTLVLDKVIGNTGTLTLSGSFDASALQLNKTDAGRLSLSGERVGLTESGFSQGVEYSVQLVEGGTTVNDGVSISHRDYLSRTQLVLGADGVARAGGAVDYTHFFLTGGDSAVVSEIADVSKLHQETLAGVTMESGSLEVDQSIAVNATGGSIHVTDDAVLSGTVEDTAVSTAAGDYSSVISALLKGDTTLEVNGGSITVSGDNSYTDGTVVNGGALFAGHNKVFGAGDVTVNGASLDLSRFTIANKVRLNGNSTLGHADGAAHIVLGGGSKVNIRDGFTLSSGKVLEVSAGGATYAGALTLGGGTLNLAGMLTVTGDVVFESGKQTTIDVSGWSGLDDGDVLIDFGGSHSGYTDSSLKLSGMAGEWELAFDAATGVLTLEEVKPEPAPEPEFKPSLSPNQQLVYDTMKDIMGEATPDGLLGELGKEVTGTRDEAKLKQLLDELGGAEYAALLGNQQAAASGHMRRLRSGLGNGWALAGTSARANIEIYSHQRELDADSRGRGYELTETGGQFSLEFISDEHTSGGFAVAAGRSKLQPDGGMTQHSDNTYLDAFLVHRDGAYTGKFSLGVGVHKYDLDRRVAGREVSADVSGSSVNIMHESAYAMQLDETSSVQVFGAVESSMNKLDAFTEQGADTASLQVEGLDAWVTTLSVGARYHYSFAAVEGAAAATLSLQAGVEYDLGDTDSEVEMNFTGARRHSFKQSGAKRDAFGYNLGASLHVPVSAKAALYASGDAVLRGNSYEVNANAGVQIAF